MRTGWDSRGPEDGVVLLQRSNVLVWRLWINTELIYSHGPIREQEEEWLVMLCELTQQRLTWPEETPGAWWCSWWGGRTPTPRCECWAYRAEETGELSGSVSASGNTFLLHSPDTSAPLWWAVLPEPWETATPGGWWCAAGGNTQEDTWWGAEPVAHLQNTFLIPSFSFTKNPVRRLSSRLYFLSFNRALLPPSGRK